MSIFMGNLHIFRCEISAIVRGRLARFAAVVYARKPAFITNAFPLNWWRLFPVKNG